MQRGRVHEDFRTDPQPTLDRLSALLGIEPLPAGSSGGDRVNRGLSDRSAAILRRVNAFSRFERMPEEPIVDLRLRRPAARVLRKLDRSSGGWRRPRGVEREVAALVGDRFAASNRDLAALLGVDLAALGYRV